jgi:hypothetical protein
VALGFPLFQDQSTSAYCPTDHLIVHIQQRTMVSRYNTAVWYMILGGSPSVRGVLCMPWWQATYLHISSHSDSHLFIFTSSNNTYFTLTSGHLYHHLLCQEETTWRLRRSDPSTQIMSFHYHQPFARHSSTTTRHPPFHLRLIPHSHLPTIYPAWHRPLTPLLEPHPHLFAHTSPSPHDYSSPHYRQR